MAALTTLSLALNLAMLLALWRVQFWEYLFWQLLFVPPLNELLAPHLTPYHAFLLWHMVNIIGYAAIGSRLAWIVWHRWGWVALLIYYQVVATLVEYLPNRWQEWDSMKLLHSVKYVDLVIAICVCCLCLKEMHDARRPQEARTYT